MSASRILGRLGIVATYGLASLLLRRPADAVVPPPGGETGRPPSGGDRSDPSSSRNGRGNGRGNGSVDATETESVRDRAPGDEHGNDIAAGLYGYGIGLGLALLLTGLSFYVASGRSFVWSQAVPVALVALAIAQIGVHLVFFLHITTGPDNTNNVLALAFGTLIVFLVLAGSLWIMANLNHTMVPMEEILRRQR